MESEKKLCSKCGKNAPSNGNPWCQNCRTEHARKQREQDAAMIGARNFIAGANAVRKELASKYGCAPGAMFEGTAIARYILNFPNPQFPDKPAEEAKDL